jgi:hypothetical protein
MTTPSRSGPPAKPPLVLRLVALAVVAAATLGIAELALQLVDFPKSGFSPWVRDAVTGYRYAPNLQTRMSRAPEYDVEFTTNSEGMRDDHLGEKEPRRLLLIGDSFSSGYGVERGLIFADLLEEQLGVEVVNASVGGWELVHQVQALPAALERFQPDLILYALYLGNDLALNGEWEELPGGLRSRTKTFPLRPPLDLKLPALVRGVRYGLRQQQAAQSGPWVPFPEYLSMVERSMGETGEQRWADSARLLARLKDEADQSGVDLVIASFSYRTAIEHVALAEFEASRPENEDIYDFSLARSRFEEIAEGVGLSPLSLDPALMASDRGAADPLYFPIDGHWTERGHAVVAGALLEFLAPIFAE